MGISHPDIVGACIPQGECLLYSRCGRVLDILLRDNGHTLPFCFLLDSSNRCHTEPSRAAGKSQCRSLLSHIAYRTSSGGGVVGIGDEKIGGYFRIDEPLIIRGRHINHLLAGCQFHHRLAVRRTETMNQLNPIIPGQFTKKGNGPGHIVTRLPFNELGGVRGRPVRLIEREAGYNVPRTIALFRELTGDYGVQLIHGFGTPDSEAVMELAARQKVVYMPTSYDERFVNPEIAPYFFITNADYSTAGRSAVRYVAEQGATLGLARSPGGFGMAPIAAIKEEAERQGVAIVSEQDIEYSPTSAVQQALALRDAGADYIWMGNTHTAMSVLARDLRRQESDAILIGNIYAGDENFLRTAGADAEGHLSMYGSVSYGDTSVEIMEAIMAANYHTPSTHYIRGWAQALLVAEVMGMAIDRELELTGENLRDMFYE